MKNRAFCVVVMLAGLALACRDEANLYTLDGPVPMMLFQVSDGTGQVLWRIEANSPPSISEVRYGQTPAGFQQLIPPTGKYPRPFRKGEQLAVLIVSRQAIYRHEGIATGRGRFRGGFGETSPYRPNTLKEALEGRRITHDR